MAEAVLQDRVGVLAEAVGKLLTDASARVTAGHLHGLRVADCAKVNQLSKAADIETAIREHKLREALRLRQELEDKLKHVTDSIETLESLEASKTPTKKKKLIGKQARAEYCRAFQLKQQETQQLTKKLLQQQRARKRRAEELRKTQGFSEEDLLGKVEDRQSVLEEQRQIKRETLQAKLDRTLMPKQENVGAKGRREQTRETGKERPLYKVIEERYKQEVQLPELERHKTQLVRKQIYCNSLSQQELQGHVRRYKDFRRYNEERRSMQINETTLGHLANLAATSSSKFTYAVVEADRRLKEERLRIEEDRRRMAGRQKLYAGLVREIYAPQQDPSKKAEIEGRVTPALPRPQVEGRKPRPSEVKPVSSSVWVKPLAFKPNGLVYTPQPRKLPVKLDYLAELRLRRTTADLKVSHSVMLLEGDLLNADFTEAGTVAKIIDRAQKVDRAARRQELSLSMGDHSEASVEAIESVSSALLSSVKAKLALLDFATRG
jgi:hypothetical protein